MLLKLAKAAVIAWGTWCLGACAHGDSTGERDRRAAVDLFAAVGAWFAPVEIDDDLDNLIDELERSSLTPSHVYRRTDGWTETSPTTRTLEISGRLDGNVYRIVSGTGESRVDEPGDYRGRFTLEKLRREHEYRWVGEDTVCLGDVPLDMLERGVESMLLTLQRDDTDDVLDLLPSTKKSWGRLGTIRVAKRREAPGGGTALTVEIEISPEGIESEFPAFSRYLTKFVGPVEMDVIARDEGGTVWMRLKLERLEAELELASLDGKLVPLSGEPRELPEDFYLETSLSTKAGPFRVGFRELETHVRFERSDARIALVFLSAREPEWRIPFVAEPFVAAALRRPFEGDGLESRTFFVREPDGRTLMNSDFRMEVEETWLLRRLGGGFGREFDQDVERERREFYQTAIRGLRDDVLEQLGANGPPRAERASGRP